MCRILMLVSVFIWEYLEFIERSLGVLVLVYVFILGYTLVSWFVVWDVFI